MNVSDHAYLVNLSRNRFVSTQDMGGLGGADRSAVVLTNCPPVNHENAKSWGAIRAYKDQILAPPPKPNAVKYFESRQFIRCAM